MPECAPSESIAADAVAAFAAAGWDIAPLRTPVEVGVDANGIRHFGERCNFGGGDLYVTVVDLTETLPVRLCAACSPPAEYSGQYLFRLADWRGTLPVTLLAEAARYLVTRPERTFAALFEHVRHLRRSEHTARVTKSTPDGEAVLLGIARDLAAARRRCTDEAMLLAAEAASTAAGRMWLAAMMSVTTSGISGHAGDGAAFIAKRAEISELHSMLAAADPADTGEVVRLFLHQRSLPPMDPTRTDRACRGSGGLADTLRALAATELAAVAGVSPGRALRAASARFSPIAAEHVTVGVLADVERLAAQLWSPDAPRSLVVFSPLWPAEGARAVALSTVRACWPHVEHDDMMFALVPTVLLGSGDVTGRRRDADCLAPDGADVALLETLAPMWSELAGQFGSFSEFVDAALLMSAPAA